jgi:hypothetical protein
MYVCMFVCLFNCIVVQSSSSWFVSAGSFLGAEAPVPMYSLNPDLASPYLNMKSLLQNSSG